MWSVRASSPLLSVWIRLVRASPPLLSAWIQPVRAAPRSSPVTVVAVTPELTINLPVVARIELLLCARRRRSSLRAPRVDMRQKMSHPPRNERWSKPSYRPPFPTVQIASSVSALVASLIPKMAAARTASRCITETVRGTHTFEISGYSLLKGLGIGNFIRSTTFAVGGRDWGIRFYPDAIAREDGVLPYVGVYLQFVLEKDTGVMVRALCTVSLVDQTTGLPSPIVSLDALKVFSWNTKIWGNPKFMKKSTLEASPYLKNDCLVIECCVTVIKGPLVQEAMVASGFKIQVPPSDLSENLGKLLTGAVGGCNRQCIMIEDIQPAIFKAMLDFIYTDSLPAMDALDADEKDAMVKHLLVAADKYAVERMKLICASILCERLDEETGHYVNSL